MNVQTLITDCFRVEEGCMTLSSIVWQFNTHSLIIKMLYTLNASFQKQSRPESGGG